MVLRISEIRRRFRMNFNASIYIGYIVCGVHSCFLYSSLTRVSHLHFPSFLLLFLFSLFLSSFSLPFGRKVINFQKLIHQANRNKSKFQYAFALWNYVSVINNTHEKYAKTKYIYTRRISLSPSRHILLDFLPRVTPLEIRSLFHFYLHIPPLCP